MIDMDSRYSLFTRVIRHKSISTTEIYTHLDEQQLRNAVDSNPLSNLIKQEYKQTNSKE